MYVSRILTTFRAEQRFISLTFNVFLQTVICVKHLWVDVSVFCLLCELITQAVFFTIFTYLIIITNVIICWRRPMKLIMLHCTDMGTSLSCNYIASSFLITFTSYMNKPIRTLFNISTTLVHTD